jgi:hypothetical protein
LWLFEFYYYLCRRINDYKKSTLEKNEILEVDIY